MMHKGKAIRAHPLFSGFRFQNLLSALNKSLRARKHLGNNRKPAHIPAQVALRRSA
jgi:hypothetical protein